MEGKAEGDPAPLLEQLHQLTPEEHWGGSDHEVYRAKGLPVLWITTGDHA